MHSQPPGSQTRQTEARRGVFLFFFLPSLTESGKRHCKRRARPACVSSLSFSAVSLSTSSSKRSVLSISNELALITRPSTTRHTNAARPLEQRLPLSAWTVNTVSCVARQVMRGRGGGSGGGQLTTGACFLSSIRALASFVSLTHAEEITARPLAVGLSGLHTLRSPFRFRREVKQ